MFLKKPWSQIKLLSDNSLTVLILIVLSLPLFGCGSDTVGANEKTDPVLVEYPVVFIEREVNTSIDTDEAQQAVFSARNPAFFNPGAQLLFKKNAFPDSPTINISEQLFSAIQAGSDNVLSSQQNRIDIRDLSVSADGQQFLVSIRTPDIEDADEDEQPTWNIWHFQLSDFSENQLGDQLDNQSDTENTNNSPLTRLIVNDITAEQGDDLMASFLPDGRIIFASTRQRVSRAILLDEGKPQYTALNERGNNAALNLHVMNADGTNIKQLSFNMSHDFYPLVLQDGRILYSRWDTMGGNDKINLYVMNPDGTENHLVYGWHSHQLMVDETQQNIDFIKPQQLPNGDIVILLASNDGQVYQKQPITINIDEFIDNLQPVHDGSVQGEAQASVFSPEIYDFNLSANISTSGKLHYLYPLPDNSERFLLSWDACRVFINDELKGCGQLTPEELAQEGVSSAPPWYELWLYNAKENTQQLVSKTSEGKMITEAIVMQASSLPLEYIADKTFSTGLDAELANEQTASIHIRSVYDLDGQDISEGVSKGIAQLSDPSLTPAADLPARFLRLVRGVPMPPDEVRNVQNTDFGRSSNQLMREILGYTPIQPDGSVKVNVPANVPFALSVLDASGQRIGGRHRQWITLKAGENLECHGCHERNSQLPHGRLDAQAPSINLGASGGVPFTNANVNIIPMQGQTMAEADAMVNGLATLSVDINYVDIWTDPNKSTVNPSVNYTYKLLESQAPTGSECFDNWIAYCRIQINYVEHIQPLWQLPRQVFDANTAALLKDDTCTSCHTPLDNNNLAHVPAGQLDLSATASTDQPAHVTSYRDLFFNDVEQEVIEGILVDKRIEQLDENGNVVYQLDAEGELILDAEENPIPVLTTIPVVAVLSTNGARSSNGFMALFFGGSHQGRLSVHELKLISEWLDIGGQYYNTPFYQEEE